jgi:hypothetical protein
VGHHHHEHQGPRTPRALDLTEPADRNRLNGIPVVLLLVSKRL